VFQSKPALQGAGFFFTERAMLTFPQLPAATLLFLLGLSQCAHADDAADRRAIEAAAQSWTKAFNARNADQLLELATDDIVLMGAQAPPISGRQAAREQLARAVGTAKGQLSNATKEIVTDGDVAWRIAALAHELPGREAKSPAESRGQALEIWKRVQGEWRLHRQMSSGLLARPNFGRRPDPSEPVLDKPVD
jgi:ketosteroid isomerase-like protein